MKMSEMTGIAPGVNFGVKNVNGVFRIYENPTGWQRVVRVSGNVVEGIGEVTLVEIINASPDGIYALPPPLTSEQRSCLNSLLVLGYTHLAKDKDGVVYAHAKRPSRREADWFSGFISPLHRVCENLAESCLIPLVEWEGEPLDIAERMRPKND